MLDINGYKNSQDIVSVKTHGHKLKYIDKDNQWNYYRCPLCDTTFAKAKADDWVLWYSDKKDDYFGYDGFTCKDKIVRDILE